MRPREHPSIREHAWNVDKYAMFGIFCINRKKRKSKETGFWPGNSVNAKIKETNKFKGWVLYDGECEMCVDLARRWQSPLANREFGLLPLQTPWVRRRFGFPDEELLAEMRYLHPDGTSLGGMDALIELSRH